MKRFWLLLLAFVLPLQMSWAAAHFCDETVHAAVAHQVGDATGDHAAGGEPAKADTAADACCAAAHGCHGLHSVMAPCDNFSFAPAASAPLSASPPAVAGDGIRGRIERPRWPIA